MRVLQLIDSLDAGGAERMSVNIANTLGEEIKHSYLCVTRIEGILRDKLSSNVGYIFLNKKRVLDLKAIKKLNVFVKKEQIEIIHAHSSSFFLAVIIKLLNKKVKIIWHDHYGDSEHIENRSFKVLKICSHYFSHIFSVNKKLESWAKSNLKCESISYLPNFVILDGETKSTILKGEKRKRLVHLANLRPQKDHFTLIKSFKEVSNNHPDWSLHLIGKDFKDEYSGNIKTLIKKLNLESKVFIYDSKTDVFNILNQCDIGVLSSKSEGLPLALLEYGLAELPVIATNVGNCRDIIKNSEYGLLISPENIDDLTKAMIHYIDDMEKARNVGKKLKTHIELNFSKQSAINHIIENNKKVLKL